jgi:tetratricopeptide (TPR) repeat protein
MLRLRSWRVTTVAWIHFKQAQYGKAEELYSQSLAIREKTFGKVDSYPPLWPFVSRTNVQNQPQRHPDVARSMHDLAELYHEQGKYKQAEKLVHKALVIREQVPGSSAATPCFPS